MRQSLVVALIAIVWLSGCRSDVPPPKEICLADGFGGADCVEADGSRRYRSPSELQNYWMTNQADIAAFSAWCYKTNIKTAEAAVNTIERSVKP